MRKVLRISFFILLITSVIAGLAFVNKQPVKIDCTKINVSVIRPDSNHYITEDEVHKMISYFCSSDLTLDQEKLSAIELFMLKNKSIQRSEVYIDVNGQLNVSVTQCQPIGRIINAFGDSYYMDKSGKIIPVFPGRPSRVVVISGDIKDSMNGLNYSQKNDTLFNNTLLDELYSMLMILEDKPFLKKMIQQVYIDSLQQITLIPILGPDEIILGNTDHLQGKLKKLELFYKRAMQPGYWKNYKTIDLRFKNQIVCKSIGYVQPQQITDTVSLQIKDSTHNHQQLNNQIN